MTQLVELRDGYAKFEDAGIKLYAVSYDDQEVLAEFTRAHEIPYPLLSDLDSEVIDAYGIRNDQIQPGDGPLYGIPYPGTYVCDEDGVVIEKFFHDTYKRREGAETLIDSAVGQLLIDQAAPTETATDGDDIRVSATFHGGALKQGLERRIVVRFELPEGLHVYGEPVPRGMIPTKVKIQGPEGLVLETPVLPPTQSLMLESLDLALPVWSGTVDFVFPCYANSTLASECRPLDESEAKIELEVRYQACDTGVCLLPRTENLSLTVPIEPIDVPAVSMHMGHGQREALYDGTPHMKRLMLRKIRESPLGFLRFVARSIRLEIAARFRSLRA